MCQALLRHGEVHEKVREESHEKVREKVREQVRENWVRHVFLNKAIPLGNILTWVDPPGQPEAALKCIYCCFEHALGIIPERIKERLAPFGTIGIA